MGEPCNPKTERWKHKIYKAKEWGAQHKTEIIVSITVITVGIIAWKNKEALRALILKAQPLLNIRSSHPVSVTVHAPLPNAVAQTAEVSTRIVSEHNRIGFVRQLPLGQNPSPAKVAEATAQCIFLGDGQTWVNPCTVGSKCA